MNYFNSPLDHSSSHTTSTQGVPLAKHDYSAIDTNLKLIQDMLGMKSNPNAAYHTASGATE